MATPSVVTSAGTLVLTEETQNSTISSAGTLVLTEETAVSYISAVGVYVLADSIPPFEPTGPIVTAAGIYIYFDLGGDCDPCI